MRVLVDAFRWATYRSLPSFYDEFPLPSDWRPLTTADGKSGRLWQWVVVNPAREVIDGGTLVLEIEDAQEAAYEAMTRFQADRNLMAHELWGLRCAARKATDPARVGVVDGRDW